MINQTSAHYRVTSKLGQDGTGEVCGTAGKDLFF